MVSLTYYTTGVKKEVECGIILGSKNTINFENKLFLFSIHLQDIVDIEDFLRLLNNKEKKIILTCSLKIQDRVYRGKRKLLNKGVIAVSQGGIRIEFNNNIKQNLYSVVNTLKNR